MEKYINKEDLGEMIIAIASCAVENAETLRKEEKSKNKEE